MAVRSAAASIAALSAADRPVVPMTSTTPAIAAAAGQQGRRLGRGEIDDAVGPGEGGGDVVGDENAKRRQAGKRSGVAAKGRRARAFQGANERNAVSLGNEAE